MSDQCEHKYGDWIEEGTYRIRQCRLCGDVDIDAVEPVYTDDDWDELIDDINDGWAEEEIADMLDAGICPECGAELDICGHAKLFEFPDDGHVCYWIEIEMDDDDE